MMQMDEINKVRKAYFKDGLSINEIAVKYRRSWETVNAIINSSREDLEIRGKKPLRESKIITPPVVNAVLACFEEEARLRVKRKQKYSATKIFTKLKTERIYNGSKRTMQGLVQKLRREYAQSKQESHLPLAFELGSSLQIDHGEVDCIIGGERMTCFLFAAGVPGEALRHCQLFPTKSREAWGEFHERTFRFFGGIFPNITYDNDTVLIKGINGDSHIQTDFSLNLEEHFGFESHFCNPAAGNEKGSVENAVGYCRRNYLAGCPSFEDFTEANSYLEKQCRDDIDSGRHYKNDTSLNDIMEALKIKLSPLLPQRSWQKRDKRLVNSYQLVEIDNHFYSVPESFVRSYVRIGVGAFSVNIFHDDRLIAQHPRKFRVGEDSLLLDHYLGQLLRKPGAFWDCKATKALVLEGDLQEIWRQLEARYKPRQAQLEFIKILSMQKSVENTTWEMALKKAIEFQSFESSAIESILRMLVTAPPQIGQEDDVRNKLPHISIPSFQFDLSPYAALAEGGSTC